MSIGKDKNIEKYQNRVDSVRMSFFLHIEHYILDKLLKKLDKLLKKIVSKKVHFKKKHLFGLKRVKIRIN